MIDSVLVPVEDLDAADRRAMRRLLDAHFLGVTAASFEADLADKTHALLLRRGGDLVGFSTLARYYALGDAIVCSGDTIVGRDARASAELPRRWIAAVRGLGADRWLLLCGGWRTYRLLSTFWQRFVPHHAGDDPLLESWRYLHASERYGDRFDPASGVVRVANPTPLRPGLADVPAGRLRDPHVAHFARLNPGHAAGDELACFCDLGDDNLTPPGRRMAGAH